MPIASATLSLRVPAKIKTRIDKAAKAQRKSRSGYILDAVMSQLELPDSETSLLARTRLIEEFMADIEEAGTHFSPRSAEDIDAQVRENRGDV